MSETLTYVEAATIIAAMNALKQIEARYSTLSYSATEKHDQGDAGRMTAIANVAGDVLFDVLNTAHARMNCPYATAAINDYLERDSEPEQVGAA